MDFFDNFDDALDLESEMGLVADFGTSRVKHKDFGKIKEKIEDPISKYLDLPDGPTPRVQNDQHMDFFETEIDDFVYDKKDIGYKPPAPQKEDILIDFKDHEMNFKDKDEDFLNFDIHNSYDDFFNEKPIKIDVIDEDEKLNVMDEKFVQQKEPLYIHYPLQQDEKLNVMDENYVQQKEPLCIHDTLQQDFVKPFPQAPVVKLEKSPTKSGSVSKEKILSDVAIKKAESVLVEIDPSARFTDKYLTISSRIYIKQCNVGVSITPPVQRKEKKGTNGKKKRDPWGGFSKIKIDGVSDKNVIDILTNGSSKKVYIPMLLRDEVLKNEAEKSAQRIEKKKRRKLNWVDGQVQYIGGDMKVVECEKFLDVGEYMYDCIDCKYKKGELVTDENVDIDFVYHHVDSEPRMIIRNLSIKTDKARRNGKQGMVFVQKFFHDSEGRKFSIMLPLTKPSGKEEQVNEMRIGEVKLPIYEHFYNTMPRGRIGGKSRRRGRRGIELNQKKKARYDFD